MSREFKWGCLAPLVGLISLIGIVLALDAFVPSAARRALPASATDIQEYYRVAGFGGDFARHLRARCSLEDFHAYARQQGLLPVVGDRLPEGCPTWSYSGESWWTPPSTITGGYYSYKKGGIRKLLVYHHGFLYYDIVAW